MKAKAIEEAEATVWCLRQAMSNVVSPRRTRSRVRDCSRSMLTGAGAGSQEPGRVGEPMRLRCLCVCSNLSDANACAAGLGPAGACTAGVGPRAVLVAGVGPRATNSPVTAQERSL